LFSYFRLPPRGHRLPNFLRKHKAAFIFSITEVNMPVVHIHMYKGRTKEQKKELVRRISKDFEEVVNVKPDSLHILFQDIDKEDWGTRGTLATDL
jgi:4-oxalocrotonate tautomerase